MNSRLVVARGWEAVRREVSGILPVMRDPYECTVLDRDFGGGHTNLDMR